MDLTHPDFARDKLCVHHIGARIGNRQFPNIPKFEPEIVTILYDADADCAEQMAQESTSNMGNVRVFPYCISDRTGYATFNLNYDPCTCSLYDANPRYASFYFFNKDHDYVGSEVLRPVERRIVRTSALDDLVKSGAVPAPDFISMDTQGAEYDILQGMPETLSSRVLALELEVSFHEYYKGQKLFGELTSFLAKEGFDFVGFPFLHQQSPHRERIGARGDGYVVCGDAIYFRRPESILTSVPAELQPSAFRKLAYIAIVHNQFEFAMQCLTELDRLKAPRPTTQLGLFLADVYRAARSLPEVFPGTFQERYTFEESCLRFQPVEKQVLKGPPSTLYRERVQKHMQEITTHLAGPSTLLEDVLRTYGLGNQAGHLQSKRIEQLRELLENISKPPAGR